VDLIFQELDGVGDVQILASHLRERLGVFSFIIKGLHFNLAVKLLNDRFGIQVRGGCSCAGTYGHYLLEVDRHVSHVLTSQISSGDLSGKPGWVRMSIHPTMTDEEVLDICQAIKEVALHWREWAADYTYNRSTNEFSHNHFEDHAEAQVEGWFSGK
jgi:selenocysteine lyase/cysteine desulfurase